jgi:hypothetical protein
MVDVGEIWRSKQAYYSTGVRCVESAVYVLDLTSAPAVYRPGAGWAAALGAWASRHQLRYQWPRIFRLPALCVNKSQRISPVARSI